MTDIEILEQAEHYVGIHYINGVEDPYINPCLLRAIKAGVAALRRTAEHDKAMEEGSPCKVGDTLYEIDAPEYGTITCKVLWISYYNGPIRHIPGETLISVWSAHVEVIDGHGKGSTYDFEQGDFGKTVFLTRAEAEAALSGGGGADAERSADHPT